MSQKRSKDPEQFPLALPDFRTFFLPHMPPTQSPASLKARPAATPHSDLALCCTVYLHRNYGAGGWGRRYATEAIAMSTYSGSGQIRFLLLFFCFLLAIEFVVE